MTLMSCLSRSLKVVGTDTYWSATSDFLLTYHSKHGPISYRFRDKRRFQSKMAKFSYPMYLMSPLKGSPWISVLVLGVKKTRMMGLPGREKSLMVSYRYNMWMWRTDRRTDWTRWLKKSWKQVYKWLITPSTRQQQRPCLRIASASRGKSLAPSVAKGSSL